MDLPQRRNSGNQTVFLCNFFRKKFLRHPHLPERLIGRFLQRPIGKSLRQRVDRLQNVQKPPVLLPLKDLWLIHNKSIVLPHKLSPENIVDAALEHALQINLIKPGQFQRTARILYGAGNNLQSPEPLYLNKRRNTRLDGSELPLPQIPDRNGQFVYLIAARIMHNKIAHRKNPELCERLRRFLPDPLNLPYRILQFQTVIPLKLCVNHNFPRSADSAAPPPAGQCAAFFPLQRKSCRTARNSFLQSVLFIPVFRGAHPRKDSGRIFLCPPIPQKAHNSRSAGRPHAPPHQRSDIPP